MSKLARTTLRLSAVTLFVFASRPSTAPLHAQATAASPVPPSAAPALSYEFAFEARVTVGKPLVVGNTSLGLRRVVPITGGRIEGAKLRGQVVAGGADFQFVRPDGVLSIEAKYTLQADDGTLITIANRGLRRGPPKVIERLSRGEPVAASEYYFRTVADFEAPTGSRHDWLNGSIFVGVAERQASLVIIRFYEIK
jgi:hypothetical protein